MSSKSSAKVLKANRRVSRRTFDTKFGVPVCGIDEAGRGPLAGPVVTACVYIPADHIKHPVWRDVADSKQLLPQKREYLYELIIQRCVYHIAEASVEEIDTLNIHHATLLAMTRAYDGVHGRGAAQLALVDGKFAPKLSCEAKAVVKGDDLSLSIAAASILAKVTRDRMMARLHEEHPYYGWLKNAGYGTEEHMIGIARYGITAHHRKSFAPCQAAHLSQISEQDV
jgi:ribonuclease HII